MQKYKYQPLFPGMSQHSDRQDVDMHAGTAQYPGKKTCQELRDILGLEVSTFNFDQKYCNNSRVMGTVSPEIGELHEPVDQSALIHYFEPDLIAHSCI